MALWKKKEVVTKSVPKISAIAETTRDGINKSYIPKYLYKPPFGYPRYTDIPSVRAYARTPYVEMCITTILDEIAAIPWAVTIKEGKEDKYTDENGKIKPEKQAEIDHVTNFLQNPNTNKETFEDVFIRKAMRDMLEVNTGVLNKVFNMREQMVEIVARDGGSFTINPDIHGMLTNRADILLPKYIVPQGHTIVNDFLQMSAIEASYLAAYFQYGWVTSPMPVPFGKREIVFMERNPRSDEIYGVSPVMTLLEIIKLLTYAVDADLSYYNDNNVPKGIIGLEGANDEEIEEFQETWKEAIREKDALGEWKKKFHKVPITNKIPQFTRIEFSASEMQSIEKQKWYAKMVWACFGVTSTELGYTEDAKGMANQIVQSKVFKKRAINPLVRRGEFFINSEVVPEFEYEDLEFKFLTFDIEDERAKAELYKIQVENGLKTVNEVRMAEGDKPVDWGEEPPRNWQGGGNTFAFPESSQDLGKERDFQERSDEAQKTPKPKEKEATPKQPSQVKAAPADPSQNPLLLDTHEVAAEKRLSAVLLDMIRANQEKIKKLLEQQFGADVLSEVKSIDQLISAIKGILTYEGVKLVSDSMIKSAYLEGHETAEKALDRNFVVNTPALEFLQEHTFDNIKDMNEEVGNDLRADLQRAIIDGKGIDDLKACVEKVMKTSKTRAEAIARTETNRAFNQGRLLAYKGSGVDTAKWLNITYDDRTSEISKAMGRKYGSPEKAIPIGEDFEVVVNGNVIKGQAPPFHVNERDVLMIEVL